jgi:hypothetical protein
MKGPDRGDACHRSGFVNQVATEIRIHVWHIAQAEYEIPSEFDLPEPPALEKESLFIYT